MASCGENHVIIVNTTLEAPQSKEDQEPLGDKSLLTIIEMLTTPLKDVRPAHAGEGNHPIHK